MLTWEDAPRPSVHDMAGFVKTTGDVVVVVTDIETATGDVLDLGDGASGPKRGAERLPSTLSHLVAMLRGARIY